MDQIIETGDDKVKGLSIIISASSFPIIRIKTSRNLTTQDGQIIKIENGPAIIASTYNETDIPEKIETAQGTKSQKITQLQIIQSRNIIIRRLTNRNPNLKI